MPKIPSKIGGYTIEHLLNLSEQTVTKKTKDSTVLDVEAEERIPKFDASELQLGRVLGRGGFCVVNEVKKVTLKDKGGTKNGQNNNSYQVHDEEDEHHIHNIVQDRNFMEANCLRGKSKDCRYAIKKLQDTSYKDTTTFVNGVVDLAIEARFLSVIRHPNIIKMRATCTGSPYTADFFVVLDRLYDIMSQRIAKWKKQQPTGMRKLMDRSGKKVLAFWLERITVAYDLACALKYLHDMGVMYRDIKPDNIGFDVRGDVKIFDFGLAKEFDENNRDSDGNYKLTGETGSPRYMATEVALDQPYNESVDVYSYCILLWQILQLETPFEKYTMSMFRKRVVQGGARPACDPKWPKELVDMMKNGWGEPSGRPTMEGVCEVLREEVTRNSDEDIEEVMDASRKSALSLHGGSARST